MKGLINNLSSLNSWYIFVYHTNFMIESKNNLSQYANIFNPIGDKWEELILPYSKLILI